MEIPIAPGLEVPQHDISLREIHINFILTVSILQKLDVDQPTALPISIIRIIKATVLRVFHFHFLLERFHSFAVAEEELTENVAAVGAHPRLLNVIIRPEVRRISVILLLKHGRSLLFETTAHHRAQLRRRTILVWKIKVLFSLSLPARRLARDVVAGPTAHESRLQPGSAHIHRLVLRALPTGLWLPQRIHHGAR